MHNQASYRHWLSEKLGDELTTQVKRLRLMKDVKHIRLMADAHLAENVCVGCVLATTKLIYPTAIGGDIGCGMLAAPIAMCADDIQEKEAAVIFKRLSKSVPIIQHKNHSDLSIFGELSAELLQKEFIRNGSRQIGTLGQGNHFLELQRCKLSGQLWLMIHTGSRCMGPAIRDFHLNCGHGRSHGLTYLDSGTESGEAFLQDMQWARRYASVNRLMILAQCEALFHEVFQADINKSQLIHCDHNHCEQEDINGQSLWLHRKGACSVRANEQALIPGSMGSDSFHVVGTGSTDSMFSCSHGAGRTMSRFQARRSITSERLKKQLSGVFYQAEKLAGLTEEAPESYKRIGQVIKSQKNLFKVKRQLEPILSYKGTT
ncbi:RtcB family protein [Zooshikella sp. RANM57]|uniref:RtcB family protein n=1 Tax=Zooshikella sp. RANM57 TaxID=3425863 RepID=UPI003D6E4228